MGDALSPDYLVVGAGAMGMAFVDTLVTDTNATVILVDRYARPGGHWTMAYPFVRLHQPSSFYGVNSRRLGEETVDQVGLNKGLAELATADEICAYYSTVMDQTFLSSGRVQYYPKHEYRGDGSFQSILTGKITRVGESTRIVDATYMKVKVPAMRPPAYQVSENVSLVTPNDLPKVSRPYGGYTVVGAGKTGIDSCLWLLLNGIDPHNISWIMPRDSWFLDRGGMQPGPMFAHKTSARLSDVKTATMAASSAEDLFRRLEACGHLMRFDNAHIPRMFRCATISTAELEQIQRIKTIVRLGRVISINETQVMLEKGVYEPVPDTLYIDCTADGLAKLDPVAVFEGRTITLQSVRSCQQVFSAALIAHVEVTYKSDQLKNELCHVIPHPCEPLDYLTMELQTDKNGLRWSKEPPTAAWLKQARLDWFGKLLPPPPEDPTDLADFYDSLSADIADTCAKLKELINTFPG